MKTNKVKIIIVILSIALVFSLISMIFLILEINKYNNKEPIKPNLYICEKREETDNSKQIYRDEISYSDGGKVVDYKTGFVIEFKNSKELDNYKKNTDTSNQKYKVIDNNRIFNYDNYETEFKDDAGNTNSTWYKTFVNSRIKDGYNCYKEVPNEKK